MIQPVTALVQNETVAAPIDPSGIHYYEFTGCRKFFPSLRQQIHAYGFWGIIFAGLIDGINPCAFTVIIFLTSLLAYVRATRKQTLLVGVSYTLAVFFTYLLLGVGLLQALATFVSLSISRTVTCCVAGFTLLLGIFSLYDFLIYIRSRKPSRMLLQLPRPIKDRIHTIMRNRITSGNLVVGAFLAGFLVSLLESLCTGQIYLPTIALICQNPSLKFQWFFCLLAYNLMFVFPLIIVLAVVYLGFRFTHLIALSERYTGITKLLLALVFFALALLLFLSV